MQTSLRRGALVLAMAVALGSTVTAASAETWRAADPSGDVSAGVYDPEPAPCGTFTATDGTTDGTTDIVGLDAHHRKNVVELAAHFRDLTGSGYQVVSFAIRTNARIFAFDVRRDDLGRVTADVLVYPEQPIQLPTDSECSSFSVMAGVGSCPGADVRMSAARDLVSVEIPRACLGDPRWVRVGVSSRRAVGEALRSDQLVPAGADPSQFPGPVGPRVQRG